MVTRPLPDDDANLDPTPAGNPEDTQPLSPADAPGQVNPRRGPSDADRVEDPLLKPEPGEQPAPPGGGDGG